VPKIELIDPATIPGGYTMYGGRLLLEATDHLKRALHGAKALKITPEPYERTNASIQTYRKAAKALGIGVVIRRVGSRTYQNGAGEQRKEARELYICITKAAAKPNPAASGARTVDTLSQSPITIPPAPFEKTLIPGMEVSR